MAEQTGGRSGTKFPQYCTVAGRLDTFVNWPSSNHQQPKELAEAGFFYQGDGDVVKCYSCALELSGWTPVDVAWTEHEKFESTCEHVQQHRMGGMNFGNSDVDEVAQGHTVETSGDDSKSKLQHSEENPIQKAKHTSRKRGDGDVVKCYSCALELSGWTPVDVAWTEHEKFESTCEHVQQHRMGGMNFGNSDVDEVAQGHTVETSGDDSKSKLQHSEENPIQKAKHTSRKRETIEEELQRLHNHLDCKTCMKERACMVILPCYHMTACPTCVEYLRSCNVCHKPIKATVKAYCA